MDEALKGRHDVDGKTKTAGEEGACAEAGQSEDEPQEGADCSPLKAILSFLKWETSSFTKKVKRGRWRQQQWVRLHVAHGVVAEPKPGTGTAAISHGERNGR